MAKGYRGPARRPTEQAAEERADAQRDGAATCPHADFRARYGWPSCRVCGAGAGSVGVGCAYRVGGAADPGQQGVGGVHAEVGREQAIPKGAVA